MLPTIVCWSLERVTPGAVLMFVFSIFRSEGAVDIFAVMVLVVVVVVGLSVRVSVVRVRGAKWRIEVIESLLLKVVEVVAVPMTLLVVETKVYDVAGQFHMRSFLRVKVASQFRDGFDATGTGSN